MQNSPVLKIWPTEILNYPDTEILQSRLEELGKKRILALKRANNDMKGTILADKCQIPLTYFARRWRNFRPRKMFRQNFFAPQNSTIDTCLGKWWSVIVISLIACENLRKDLFFWFSLTKISPATSDMLEWNSVQSALKPDFHSHISLDASAIFVIENRKTSRTPNLLIWSVVMP